MLLQNSFANLPYTLHPFLSAGAVGEAGQRGGDAADQVLHPVEEAEGEGDPAGNHWQRKSKKHQTDRWRNQGGEDPR